MPVVDGITKTFFADYWKNWSKFVPADQKDSVLKSGSYSMEIMSGKILLISFNSSVFDSTNIYTKIDSTQFDFMYTWLETQLQQAQTNNQQVWIIQHEPGCSSTTAHTQKYLNLVQKYNNIIKYEFSGHTHINEFRF